MKVDEYKIELFRKLKENDIPIIHLEGEEYTPEDLYAEQINYVLPQTPDWDLITKRLEIKYERGLIPTLTSMSGTYTAFDQLNEVKNNTGEGFKFMLNEFSFIKIMLDENRTNDPDFF